MILPPNLSFQKFRRLTRTAEFEFVRREGKKWRSGLLTLAIAVSEKKNDPARVGIIVSRKVGAAVIRNRARRRVREIFRKHQHAVTKGVWMVVIVSPRAARASQSQLEDEWLRLAGRASILSP